MSSLEQKNVLVTGGAGFLGGVLCERIRTKSPKAVFVPRRRRFDLTERAACKRLYREAFGGEPADYVFHLAAEVGGIGANQKSPGRFFYANMAMALNLIEEFRELGWHEHDGKFVQVGTVCAYPKYAPVPFREDDIWNGFPEETNAPYGIAKRAAWQMLDAYRRQYGMRSVYVVPVNLYGPRDNFDPETSHVIPALIRKCEEARESRAPRIVCWGSGRASREFLYVEDAADGILTAALALDDPQPINLGTGEEITIRDLASLIAEVTGYEGQITWDEGRPDGQPRRCLDVTRARGLGFEARVGLREGLSKTVQWYRACAFCS